MNYSALYRQVADMILAARHDPPDVLTFGTIVEDLGDGTVTVHPDGAGVDTVVGPIPLIGGG